LSLDFAALVASLEEELAQVETAGEEGRGRERAILIGVTGNNYAAAEDSMEELCELARSAGLEVAATLIQRRSRFDPRFLMGKGRLSELVIQALQQGADLLVFDAELSPSQVRSITDFTELKVLDRTQLILDLFAQRARSREGKLQVEMAQVNYLLPRLVGKGDALSRLMGGIGGRGPGESKLEMDRRRLRDRLHRLRQELAGVGAERRERRQSRRRQGLPILSIIGYTNAGKSTLFNALTRAGVLSEDRLFATLDPTSRRLRFPREREVIITDTVGFIKNLPKNLLEAFKATLEELAEADLLIHVVDLSNPRFVEQMAAVEETLGSLNLQDKPLLKVFNKADLVDRNLAAAQCRIHHGVAISAIDPGSLPPLIARLENRVESFFSLAGRTDLGKLQREL
jgi:GTP-binding protein HflX